MSGSKKLTLKIRDQTFDMNKTKNLYGRLMVVTRLNRESDIDQKNAVGNYEFTLTPRTLFAPDGSMLMCTDMSKLMHELEKLASTVDGNDHNEILAPNEQDGLAFTSPANAKIAIVDGMVLVQKMTKNKKSKFSTVKDLAQDFIDKLRNMTAGFSEVILVFDTYKPNSLKEKTRERCRQGKAAVQYKIKGDTNIKHILLTHFFMKK